MEFLFFCYDNISNFQAQIITETSKKSEIPGISTLPGDRSRSEPSAVGSNFLTSIWWPMVTRGGNRLHSQPPSECDYLQSTWVYGDYQLIIAQNSVNNRTRSAVDCAADCHLKWTLTRPFNDIGGAYHRHFSPATPNARSSTATTARWDWQQSTC